MKNATNVGARFTPAYRVKTNTGTKSGDAVGLALELAVAGLPKRLDRIRDSLFEMGQPYLLARDSVQRIEADDTFTDAGKVAAVRSALPHVLADVREKRARVGRMRAQAHNARLAGIRERERVLDDRLKADPDAVRMMTDVLSKLDPLVGRQRVREAAAELGKPGGEKWPYLVAAARRARQLGLESENPSALKLAGRPLPVVDDETHAAVEDALAASASNAAEQQELAEVHSLHAAMLATTEKSVVRVAESYDLGHEVVSALAAMPADGGDQK